MIGSAFRPHSMLGGEDEDGSAMETTGGETRARTAEGAGRHPGGGHRRAGR
jgi:hypothetical protein